MRIVLLALASSIWNAHTYRVQREHAWRTAPENNQRLTRLKAVVSLLLTFDHAAAYRSGLIWKYRCEDLRSACRPRMQRSACRSRMHRRCRAFMSATDNEFTDLLLLTCCGLEDVCCDFVRDRLALHAPEEWVAAKTISNTEKGWTGGEAAVGKVLLRLSNSRWMQGGCLDALIRLLQNSCGVQLVLASVFFRQDIFDGKNLSKADALLKIEQEVAQCADELSRAASVLRRWKSSRNEGLEGPIKFRASCVRDGQHPFKSVDVIKAVGAGVLESVRAVDTRKELEPTNWKVSLSDYDAELLALQFHESLALGINLRTGHRPMHTVLPADFTGPGSLRSHWFVSHGKRVAALRPSTAALLLRLAGCFTVDADPKSSAFPYVLLDPFAGIGTIPAVAATCLSEYMSQLQQKAKFRPRTLRIIACDKDKDVIETAKANAAAATAYFKSVVAHRNSSMTFDNIELEVFCADATELGGGGLTLGTSSVNAIASELPFGNIYKREDKTIPHILNEMARVLKPLGRAVLLVQNPDPLIEHASPSTNAGGNTGEQGQQGRCYWSVLRSSSVVIGGMCCAVVVLERNDLQYALKDEGGL